MERLPETELILIKNIIALSSINTHKCHLMLVTCYTQCKLTFFNAILADGCKRENRKSLDRKTEWRKSKRRTFCLLFVKGQNNLNKILMRDTGSPVRPTHSPAGCTSQLSLPHRRVTGQDPELSASKTPLKTFCEHYSLRLILCSSFIND